MEKPPIAHTRSGASLPAVSLFHACQEAQSVNVKAQRIMANSIAGSEKSLST